MTFSTFWPEYVRAHSRSGTRAVHFLGTLPGWSLIVAAILLRRSWLILGALVVS